MLIEAGSYGTAGARLKKRHFRKAGNKSAGCHVYLLKQIDSFCVRRRGMADWNAMTAAERADHLREAFKDMIDHQDAVFADIESRINVLEEQMARLAKMIEAKF